MASPWKFLARLVSPRRQQRPEDGSADDVTPELLAIVTSSEIAAGEESVSATDPPAGEESSPHGQPVATSAAAQHPAAVSSAPGTADVGGTDFAEVADPVQPESVDAADRGAKPGQLRQRAEPGRRRRGKKAKVLEVVPPTSADVPIVNDNTINLDEEIRLLREQLASKLQLQNTQLKKMLERFER